MKTIKTRLINKHDTSTNWKTANDKSNFTPLKGEIIIYDDFSPAKIKIGDGVTTVDKLPFINDGLATDEQFNEIATNLTNHINNTEMHWTAADKNKLDSLTIATDAEVDNMLSSIGLGG